MNKGMAVCAAALAVVALAGCGKPTAKQVLDKSAAAYKAVTSLAVDGESNFELKTGGQWQGRGSETVVKYKKPNKVLQESSGQPTLISNGKTGVMYNPQQKEYMEIESEMVIQSLTGDQSGASLLGLAMEKTPYKGAKNAKLLREERIGDVDTYVVEFQPGKKFKTPGLDKAKITERVWIGKEDSLAHKRELVAIVPKDVMAQQTPPGTPVQPATVVFSSEAKKMVVNGSIADSAFQAPKGAKKMEAPGGHPEIAAPPSR